MRPGAGTRFARPIKPEAPDGVPTGTTCVLCGLEQSETAQGVTCPKGHLNAAGVRVRPSVPKVNPVL